MLPSGNMKKSQKALLRNSRNERKELIMLLINEIQKIIEQDILVIVEGAKDVKALKLLGIKNIVSLKGQNLAIFSEDLSESHDFRSVAILTDLDSEGKKLYAKLKKYLTGSGMAVDDSFRHMLYRETELRQIEGLVNYIERLS